MSKTDIKHARIVYNMEPYGKILIKVKRNTYHVWCTVKSNNKVIFNTIDNKMFKRKIRVDIEDIANIIDFIFDMIFG